MNRARTWDEFRNAIASWNAPAQNFLYADTDGHYGYILAGDIPIRAQGNGRVPVPGWTGTYEWQGYIPTSDLPATFDPPEGIAYNANNRIVDDTHPYSASIQGNWFNGYRAARIRQLLDATPRHTVESFARMQQDQLSLPGLQLAQAIADIPLHDPLEQQARTLLLDWDGMLSADSIGGAIYALLRHYLEHNAFSYLNTLAGARAGSGIFGVFPYENMLDRRLLPTLLERIAAERAGNDPDPWLPAGETWEHILQHAFGTAVAELRSHMGNNPHEWHYGRIHSIKMQHPLGMIPGLSLIFNRGPWPVGGDVDTICMGYFPRRNTATQLYIAPSYRQICDTGNWDASCSIIASGQSGHPASRHYCDMARAWLDGSYHPMAWSRTQVEQHTVATVTLEPIHGNE
jgi:penicillin amidase